MVEAPRNTRQRRAVVAILEDLDGFASAQEIHDILKQRGESVGLSTVYRSLQVLAHAKGMAREIGYPVHTKSSLMVGLEAPTVERWADRIAEENGFHDVAHTLEVFGTCGDCASTQSRISGTKR